MAEAYTPSPKTKEMYEHFTTVSRVKNASYGNGIFKTDERFKGRPVAECVMMVLDDPEMTAQFLAENEEYKENNALATTLFGQFKKTGRTPKDLARMSEEVKELYQKKLDDFRSKFDL